MLLLTLSQAPYVTCPPSLGPASQSPCHYGYLTNSMMGSGVTHVQIKGIFAEVTTVAVIKKKKPTQFQWLNKMQVYILLMQSLAKALALLQAVTPESSHLMALPSWLPWRLGLPVN